MFNDYKKIKELTMASMMLALMIIASKISIPIGPIPLTLQTFAVFIISLVIGKKASIIFIIYLILGLIGLPVFTSGGGIEYIFMPSFGFIIGFIPASFVIGFASRSNKFYLKYILSILGLFIINVFGVAYMYIIFKYHNANPKDLMTLVNIGVAPFIFKDMIIAILSCIIYSRLKIVLYKEKYDENINFNEKKIIK